MTLRSHSTQVQSAIEEVRSLSWPLRDSEDLDGLIDQLSPSHFVCLGEASHGTHEYYTWRAQISRRLIIEGGFTWIGVEGDWPDCWRINEWLGGIGHQSARDLLTSFRRWPTWMWANEEVADFLEWLRSHNETVPTADKVGFYGLDVYSLWDSLRRIIQWLEENDPSAVAAALEAWHCFSPYDEDPHRYAWATRLVPEACEDQVVALLVEVRRQAAQLNPLDDAAFDAFQNAEVVAGAEHYYRAMVRGDRESWNVRDRHMTDTIERIWRHRGLRSHGLIWEHNTHLGDARATDMARSGMVNVGQLLRERHEGAGVSLVGFAGHHGTVIAASQWGEAERVMAVPDARPGSHEDLLHRALGIPALVLFGHDRSGPWLSTRAGHRAIGVVYDSRMEAGNYVPTRMGDRYDALIWLENTSALHPLHHEGPPMDEEFETEPTGY